VDVVQPVLWAVMVSLAAVWEAAGVRPDAVVGHSQGEIAAAVVAGILSLEDAAKVVALRSKALIALSGRGGMLSIAEFVDAVELRIAPWADRVSVAAVNGPGATVVSGTPEALEEIRAACERDGVRARILPVDYASHGPQVDELRDEILSLLAGITPQPTQVPMVSAMTGEHLQGPELDAEYWYASLRATVQFSQAVEVLARSRHSVFIEASAHPVLTSSISATLEKLADPEDPEGLSTGPAPVVTGTLRRDEGGPARLLASLAEAHVNGVVLDWSAILPVGQRVDLPTYAFQRQHFWSDPVVAGLTADGSSTPGESESEAQARFWAAVENGDVATIADTLAVDGQRLDDLLPALASWRRRERDDAATKDWRYRVSWAPVREPESVALHGTWLVVAPAAGIEAKLHAECVAALTASGADVLLAEIESVEREAIEFSLRDALGDLTPAGVLSLLALDETRLTQHPAVASGVAGTLGLVQALGELGIAAPLWVLTSGAVATTPSELLSSPVQAQVWGLGRVAGLEHPERWGGLIDLPSALDTRAMHRLAVLLAGCGEDQAAIRSAGIVGRRLVRGGASRGSSGSADVWKPRGTVLVTGASGGIGPSLAGWLAEAGAPRLALVSRRGPMVAGAAAVAAELAAAGTSVSLASCDVTDRDAVAGLLGWINGTGPALSTVIHSALAVDLLTLSDTGIDDLALALGAKVAGADLLDELTADLDLDEFVLFSSIAATWGVSEHGSYAAANAHLDALAENRRTRGLPATSVAWGVWDTGQEANGADHALSVIPERLRRQGLRLLDPGRALSALGQILAAGNAEETSVLSVADVDWPRFSAVFNAMRSWPLLDEIPEARQATDTAESGTAAAVVTSGEAAELLSRLVGATSGKRERIVTDLVRAHAAAVLGHASTDAVEADRAFRDMGFDSLTAVELRGRLNQATGLQLPSTVVFDYPSPLVLARRILTQLLGSAQLGSGRQTVPDHAGRAAIAATDPIAIVGLGCRFPGGANSPDALWQLLATGGDAVGRFPADRGWDIDALLGAIPGRTLTSVTREGGFIAGVADFDPAFFRISPREALAMDPQQRLLLETSWEALEHAGFDPVALRGSSTGVFAGAAASGYAEQSGFDDESAGHLITGNVTSVISGRISYTLGLEGPAVTVDTACSSGLVALHLAAQALRGGECDLALAGGVMVITNPGEFIGFSQQGALAGDGRCKAFSADADGMGLAEGAGMVVLERLSDARRNGNTVLAVVAGSSVNQDGASNGLSAPNGPSQQRVIRAALASAGLEPGDVDAVEGHGTGTTLGDPIEAQAILATYGQGRLEERPLWLGSVKSNIGHAQQAAGVAGVMKMVLALQHNQLPATLHADVPSPHVDWSEGNVRLLTEAVGWAANGRPRRAGVSAFGISGTNAHMIIEEAPGVEPSPESAASAQPDVPSVLSDGTAWLVSAQTPDALRAQASRLADYVSAAQAELVPADVAWSLATTRSVFEHRAVVTGADRDELLAGLGALVAGRPGAGLVSGAAASVGPVVFVFPGQGSQWVGMGRELAQTSPVFAGRLAECGSALAPYVDWSLDDVLAGREDAPGFDRVDVVQPVLWAVMVSLAAVWESAGVIPDAVLGHSQGEIAAAVVAGILSLEDAAKVVALRSKALIALSGRGGMLSIAESADAVRNRITDDRIAIATINGPGATVVSGEPEALQQLLATCESEGVRARMLPVDYASHGPQVDELREEILGLLTGLTPREGVIPMVSALTGEYVQGPELDAEYWYASLRGTVEFSRATEVLGSAGYGVFIETSAHPVLTNAITDTLETQALEPIVTGTLRRDEGGPARLLTSLAEVHVHGVAVDWSAVLPQGERVGLPTYAFQRQRYWPKSVAAAHHAGDDAASAQESAFWTAVAAGDLESVSQTLGLHTAGLRDVLPALAAWRQRERDESAVEAWRYRITWTAITQSKSAALSDTWLLVAPAGSAHGTLTADCRTALADRGAEVVLVEIPAHEVDRESLRVRITQALNELDDALPVSGVVSLLALDTSPLDDSPVVPRGLAGTLGLTQALGDAAALTAARLWVLTSGAVSAGGETLTGTLQAQTWAFGRVAALEHPDRWGGLIDLPPTWDAKTADRLVGILARPGEDQVAIRSTGVLGRRLVRAPRPTQSAPTWKPAGSVLITGGTGGVGGHVARWLTTRDASQIVLSSRSGPAASGAAALAAELASAGSDVAVLAGDVGDRAHTAGLLTWIDAHGPAVSSIMHAAGAAPGGPVDTMTSADLTNALQAKAGGATYLDELTADRELDAFVMFSSGAAAWGSAQLSGYAAANAALDALVEERRARGRVGTSVAWGLWGGGGMGEGPAGEMLQRLGVREMDAGLAVAALAGALDAGEDLAAVSDIDWSRFATIFTVQRPSPLLADLPEARQAIIEATTPGSGANKTKQAAGTELRRQLTGLDRTEQERILSDLVRAEAAAVLGYATSEAVPPTRAFKDLGFDSLTAVDLRTRLNTATGLKLPATLVFDYPTPAAVVQFLRTELLGIQADAGLPIAVGTVLDPGEPIAIIGMGCRFPGGVRGPEELWELLAAGGDAIASFPTDRGWDPDGVFAGMAADSATALVGGFVYDAADFDAGFFGISPREAVTMDPQQRLLLETAWEAVERAGISPASLKGSATGVFAGAAFGGYGQGLADEAGSEGYMLIGGLGSVISGRVSYTLGLEGPAVTVDTACSSALVALHLASQALRSGECSMALAGGVAVMSTPAAFSEFSYQGGYAFDGRCKAFAADADGIGWGEGAGMLVLERLSDAQRNGHRVLAVVAGSATNQDGASNGITAPNGPSQQKVIRTALANAGLRADEVDAVEAHGTGTALGDPIEAQALLATYGQGRSEDQPLWLGSVKTNIGHLQTAAGVAGIIKMVLALQHDELPRTLHAEVPSPHVDWSAGDVRLLNEPVSWPTNGRTRRAGVSAFGISGTNVHVILEEAPTTAAPAATEPENDAEPAALPVLATQSGAAAWPISARSSSALTAQATRLSEFALAHPTLDPTDIAWSLLTSRSVFEHRAVIVGRDRDELRLGLSAVAAGQPSASVVSGVVPATGGASRTVLVFPGQGSQWIGMGRELAETSPVFAARLAECGEALAPYTDWSLDDVLAGSDGAPGFDRVDVVQPVLWAVMVSLAAVWEAAGVRPDAVVGHSQGEIAAAVVAGILSLEDAAKVVALRSKALIALSGRGGMLSIAEFVDAVELRITPWADRVAVAAVNGPGATVVSGTPEALEEIRAACEREDVRARILPVDYASHGPQVDELRDEILGLLAGITPQQTRLPMISALTGEHLQGPELDAEYWYASLRGTVRFSRAVEELGRTGYGVFIETSAHPVLTNAISDTLEHHRQAAADGGDAVGAPAQTVIITGTLRRDDGGPARLLASLAEAHVHGVPVDWGTVVPRADLVELPTYAFQRQRYWPKAATTPVVKTANGETSAGTAIEAQFWNAVEAGDLDALSQTLAVDGNALGEVLPALTSWRARERDESRNADWRYRVSWLPMREPAPAVLTGTWLLVIPTSLVESDLAAACTRMLSDRGANVVPIEVSPTELDRSTLAARLAEILEQASGTTGTTAATATPANAAGVLSLLSIDETPLPDRPVVPVGVGSTLVLFQALSDAGTAAPLWAITQGAVRTGAADDRPISPIQAQVWGLGRTVGVEQPDRWGGLVDLPATDLNDRTAARLVSVLADGSEDQVAIRGGGVLVRRLVRSAPRQSAPGRWTPRGTVLLTGASGAIGPDLAGWLADAGAEHAVLTGRRGPATPGASRVAALLAEAGSAVTIVSCDVSDRAALSNLLQWIPTIAPPLSTVIHAAVAVELMSVDDTDLDQLELTLSAKAAGATYLDELTAGLDLDAFIFFSSISATWGVGEHATYAAANAHLDALAENRRARGLPGTSVAWGVWSSGGRFDDSAADALDRPQSLIPAAPEAPGPATT
jgi:acyl transferase domain-containing protein/acyl carrier protein